MPRRWQYPSWAIIDRDALTRPEVTTPDKWWQPFSEPVRQHAGKLAYAAIIVSGVAAIDSDALTRPEVTSLDKWWQPLSEPVRVKKPLPIAAYPSNWDDSDLLTRPESTTLDTWYKPLLGVGFKKELRLSGPDSFPQPEIEEAPAEEITLDKWYSPLTEPLLIKPRAVEFPDFSTDTEGMTQPEVTSLDRWYSPFSEPVRTQPISYAALFASGLTYVGEPTDVEPIAEQLGWFVALEEPPRGKKPLEVGARPSFFYEGEPSDVEPVAERLAWYTPLAEFLHDRKRSAAALYPHFFAEPEILTQPEATTLDRWWRPLSEFLHRVKRSAAALEPASVIDSDLLTRPEETLVSKWVPQTSEPVRVKKGLLTALQEAFFVDANIAAIPPAEDITLDKWYKPLEEPVRVKPRASEFPAYTNDTEGLTLPEVTSLDKWFSPLSEPVRVQPKSLAGLLSGATYEGEPSDVEPLAEFMGWYRTLDEPVLPLVLPIAIYPATFFEQEVSELDPSAEQLAWYVPLTDPTLPKPRVAEFLAFTIDTEGLTQPEVTSLDKWWRELSEPVRTQPRSLAALISGETKVDEPSDLDPVAERFEWYRDLDLPTLPKVRVAEFLAFVIDAELLTLPEATTLDKWWRELSEPVRVKARFLEALQLHVITDLTFDIAEIITLDKWYTPLDEPVRLGDRLVVPFRLPASVGREYQVAVIPVKGRISKEADQTHVSKEADQTHISKEADQTKDSKRC